jgi:hypothetical protein
MNKYNNKYNNEFYSAKSSKLKGGYGEFYGGNHIQITSQNDKQKLSNSYIPYSDVGNSINHVDERLKLHKKIEIDQRLKLQKRTRYNPRQSGLPPRIVKNTYTLSRDFTFYERSSLPDGQHERLFGTADERLKLHKKIEVDERLKLHKKIEIDERLKLQNKIEVDERLKLHKKIEIDERLKLQNKIEIDERLKLHNKIEIDERLKLHKKIEIFMYSIFFFYIIYCIYLTIYCIYLTIQYVMNFRVWNIFK